MKTIYTIRAAASCLVLTLSVVPAFAGRERAHTHNLISFESVMAGVKRIDKLISEIRSKVGKGDFEGLTATSEEIRAVAEGLEARFSDVETAHVERFKFNTDQLKSAATKLVEVRENKNEGEAEKIAKRIEAIRDRLHSLSPNK